MTDALEYVRTREGQLLDELVAFARIASVSTDPAYLGAVREAAQWVADRMRRAGLENVRIHSSEGHPIVTADWLHAPGAPTILVYGHYDVQPPDPLDKWLSPPFEPEVRDQRLYARGVSDDKGPLLIAIQAAEAFMASEERLPVNVKFLIEGDEERGSVPLGPFVRAHASLLEADFVLSADGAMWRADEPSVCIASRGLVSLEFSVIGAGRDLHSGRHGGAVPNAIHAISRLVASLHDEFERVAVAGFYEDVRLPEEATRAAIRGLPFDEAHYLHSIGAARSVGEHGYSLLERQWLRPTLELNGLWSGYQGPGMKTVIPSVASAKLTCRLVPGQDPQQIVARVRDHLRQHCPEGVTLEIKATEVGSRAYAIPEDHLGLSLAEQVLQELYGKAPYRVRMGATIPIGLLFREALGIDTVFFSFSTADEDYHAPNEFFRLRRMQEGLWAWIRYWRLLSRRA